ncbi:MnmG [Acrasis kona]|uniref:Mediator of RNA polymerase II transcription subunit 21 n=1 Tax=Acrasis kona TaxID=1008807 RepID=A0AAW2ZDW7_9EUKA
MYPTDNITKLQEQLSVLTSIMVDSAALHLQAPPQPMFQNSLVKKSAEELQIESNKMVEVKEHATQLGRQIFKACLDFERMLDDIPGVNSTEEEQIAQLVQLNIENEKEAQRLLKSVSLGEDLLKSVSDALQDQFFDVVQARNEK